MPSRRYRSTRSIRSSTSSPRAYKEIARQPDISTKTVETHVSSVLRKLQLSNRHELSRWPAERRIV
jgi:DNA-binding NarL/FixJ family response regulator